MNFPLFVSALSFIVLLLAAFIGDILRSKFHTLHDVERDDFGVAQNATLTFLGLLIGVSISMAISRHDLRKRLADTSDRSGCRLQAFFLYLTLTVRAAVPFASRLII